MSDVTETIPQDSPEQGRKKSDGKIRAADGTSLKRSLNRALRRQKLRALILIAPLLIFVLVTFIAPIADMLFRSVENQIVAQTLPRTTDALADWEAASGQAPGAPVYKALYEDIFIAQERKLHTRLGSRLNYELTGASSLFRKSGRGVGDMGEVYQDQFEDFDDFWKMGENWNAFLGSDEWLAEIQAWDKASGDDQPAFEMRDGMEELFPQTAAKYEIFADFVQYEDEDNLYKEDPWALIYSSFYDDLTGPTAPQIAAYDGPAAAQIKAAAAAAADFETVDYAAAFADVDKDWAETPIWETIQTYSGPFTNGYFLNAVDMQKSPDGAELRPENQRVYGTLFLRTLFMSLMITGKLHPASLSDCLSAVEPALAHGEPADDPRASAVLDLASGADLGLEGDVAATGCDQRHAGLAGHRGQLQPAGAHQQRDRHDYRDDAYPAAVHDPADVFGDADNPAQLSARRQEPWRNQLDGLLAGLFPAVGAGHRRRVDPRVHPVHRVLHHARNRGRHDRHVHLEPDCLSHFQLAQLGPRSRTWGDPAGGRAGALLGLRQDRRHR